MNVHEFVYVVYTDRCFHERAFVLICAQMCDRVHIFVLLCTEAGVCAFVCGCVRVCVDKCEAFFLARASVHMHVGPTY